jgi:predicted PurR-regulated permease PerM
MNRKARMSSQRREPAPASIEQLDQGQQAAEISGDLLTNVAAGSVAQVVIAVAIVLAVCYVAKLVMITIASSLLLAFVLEPIVCHLQRWRVPRSAGAFMALTLLLGGVYGVCHFSYNRAVAFLGDLPEYSYKIRESMLQFRQHTEQLKKTTETVLPENEQEREVVKVRTQNTWTDWLTNSASGLTELLIALSFLPFLVYFMLSWKDRMRVATVKLFSPEHRRTADETLGAIASMLHDFIVGNLLCGLFVSCGCVLAFGLLKIPYFYFLGFISGFLSLVPYLGTILAMLPPIAAGVGTLSGPGIIAVAAIVFGLDMFAINVLFPKVIGKRLQLNPLVVTIALLVWGWIWGAMGLILAIPITGAMKIIFDHIDSLRPFGVWLEE